MSCRERAHWHPVTNETFSHSVTLHYRWTFTLLWSFVAWCTETCVLCHYSAHYLHWTDLINDERVREGTDTCHGRRQTHLCHVCWLPHISKLVFPNCMTCMYNHLNVCVCVCVCVYSVFDWRSRWEAGHIRQHPITVFCLKHNKPFTLEMEMAAVPSTSTSTTINACLPPQFHLCKCNFGGNLESGGKISGVCCKKKKRKKEKKHLLLWICLRPETGVFSGLPCKSATKWKSILEEATEIR